MKDEEFYALEGLLGKLQSYIGHRYAIVPGVVHDSMHIAIYDEKTGDVKDTIVRPDLKEAANYFHDKYIKP